jgi:hypothetical protein
LKAARELIELNIWLSFETICGLNERRVVRFQRYVALRPERPTMEHPPVPPRTNSRYEW